MSQSETLFERAKKYIPGGVNSPVRSFNAVGGQPRFIARGDGAYIYDVEGKKYIDFVCSWGPLIHGHSHRYIVENVIKAAQQGMSFGAPTEREITLAEMVCNLVPAVEKVRMVSSGTEATMTAIRLARGYTKRNKILKFVGCYHGHADCLLVKAGSGVLTLSIPGSAGVPEDFIKHTLVTEYNSVSQLETIFQEHGADIAGVILEPIACNMNLVLPSPAFIQTLKSLCQQYGALLMFDEVITGFRLGLNGAQELLHVKADLTMFGKIIGGGMPVGAYGGRAEIMDFIAPLGPVYQAGTLSGNPVAMAAGIATLELLQKPNFYESLEKITQVFCDGISEIAKRHQFPLQVRNVASIFGLFFTDSNNPLMNYQDVAKCDTTRFNKFFHKMLDEGIYLAPSSFEAGFISSAHSQSDIEFTLDKLDKVLGQL